MNKQNSARVNQNSYKNNYYLYPYKIIRLIAYLSNKQPIEKTVCEHITDGFVPHTTMRLKTRILQPKPQPPATP